jgi:hypothetical protein
LIEERAENRARDQGRAQRFEVGGKHLDIEPGGTPGLKVLDQGKKRELRSPGLQVKHALGRESPAGIHPVDSSDQMGLLPDFDAVGVTESVEVPIRFYHLGGDPSPSAGLGLVRPANARAELDHFAKSLVEAHAEGAFLSGPSEAAPDMQAIEEKDRALGGSEPSERKPLDGPWKDALPVSQ